jgi:hypothetical protein
MIRILRMPCFAFGIAACLLLTSCVVTSDHPLSSPETSQPDPGLIGTWGDKGENDDVYVFTIKNGHWMHYEQRKDGKRQMACDFFVTSLDGRTYMNLLDLDKNYPGYTVIRYEILTGRGVLMSWGIDQDKAAAAVRAGRLKGTVYVNKGMLGQPPHHDVDVRLKADSDTLAAFIRDEGVGTLFADKNNDLYRLR